MDQIWVFMHECLQDPEGDAQNDRSVCYAHRSFNFPGLAKCTKLINVWSKYRAIALGLSGEIPSTGFATRKG